MVCLQIVDDVEFSFNTTLDHLLVLEDFLFHFFQPALDAPLLDRSLQIFFVEDPKSLMVILHLSKVRVDDVDDELVLGGTWEAMAPRSAESFPGRNRPRKKTHEITRYGVGTIRANI